MLLTIEVIHDGAFNLLADMERLDLIRVNTPSKTTKTPEKKLSQQFAGALHLSDTVYEEYQKLLQEGRNEWRKAIF